MAGYKTVKIMNGYRIQLDINCSGYLNCRIVYKHKVIMNSINHRSVSDAELYAKRWLENNHKI